MADASSLRLSDMNARADVVDWAPTVESTGALLPKGWLVGVLFLPTFLWWALGLQAFIGAMLALPLLVIIVVRRWTFVPTGTWLYLLFLVWVPVTFVTVNSVGTLLVAGWRYSIYVAAGILLVYVYNAPKDELPTARLMKILAGFWAFTALGGFLGMLLPALSFPSPTELLLGNLARSDPLLTLMTHPTTSLERSFLFLPLHRPNAPFAYPNQWGVNFALSLPFAIGALAVIRSPRWRAALLGLLVLSVVPLVFSLNRGAWLATCAGAVYVALRLARNRNVRALVAVVALGAVATLLLIGTPLGDLITLRLEKGLGDARRSLLYEGAVELAQRSPLIGWGGPVEQTFLYPGRPANPPIGTHGQLWMVMVSHGVFPALVLFIGWFMWVLVATGRRVGAGPRGPTPVVPGADGNARFWCHVAILMAIIQLPYYEMIPWGMPLVMTAAAIALREQRPISNEAVRVNR
jgi:polysaccharide biosynthesis protein PslJ